MSDFLRNVFEFIVFTVIVKTIIGHWMAEQILKYGQRWFTQTERNMAIWMHYQMRAQGDGHAHKDILDCKEGHCSVF